MKSLSLPKRHSELRSCCSAVGNESVASRRAGVSMEDLHYEPLPNILDEIDMNEEEVNEAWAQLLEETLPPEKHPPLDREFYSKQSLRMRYSMLLEFSSYLRQGSTQRAGSDREDEEPGPRYRKGPLGSRGDDSGPPSDFLDEKYEKWLMEQQRRGKQDDTSLVWLLMRVRKAPVQRSARRVDSAHAHRALPACRSCSSSVRSSSASSPSRFTLASSRTTSTERGSCRQTRSREEARRAVHHDP